MFYVLYGLCSSTFWIVVHIAHSIHGSGMAGLCAYVCKCACACVCTMSQSTRLLIIQAVRWLCHILYDAAAAVWAFSESL